MRDLRPSILAVVWLSGFGLAASAQTIQQIFTNGPTATRINIVFLSEGYTAAQLGQFPTDARGVLNQLLNTPPFSLYSNYFNAFAISVASTESGSDHYTPTTNLVNTYFNSTYDSYGIQRLITIPPNDRDSNAARGEGKVTTLLQTLMPQYDIVALIVNDGVYGGSGGTYLLTSINSSAPEIAVHELGHSFAKLGDEYSSPFLGYPDTEEPNTTTQTNRSLIKWRAWILDATPIPTPEISPYLDFVGLFEGAHYHTTGWYRPKFNCKMNHLGVPFCEVCSEALVKSMYGQIRPIESFSPGTNTLITLTNSSTTNLSVVSLMPSGGSVGIQWFTNDVPVPGATSPSLMVSGFSLPPGTNQVKVEVVDMSSTVRTDPTLLLKDSRTWKVKAVVIPQPTLAAVRAGSRVIISWPTNNTSGFLLEGTNYLAATTAWPRVTNSTVVTNNQNTVTVDLLGPLRFFRLRKP